MSCKQRNYDRNQNSLDNPHPRNILQPEKRTRNPEFQPTGRALESRVCTSRLVLTCANFCYIASQPPFEKGDNGYE